MTRLASRGAAMLVTAVVIFAPGCGDAGDESADTESRKVDVQMVDIAFEPKEMSVREGQTVTFTFDNRGKLPHDAFIGDEAAQAEHEQDMREGGGDGAGGGHGDHGGEELAVTVGPGKSGDLSYTFDRPGQVVIGCHQPGHYDAGMKLVVNVEPNS